MLPQLFIGNKNYSSWSMRPWFAMRAAGIAFDEVVIPLYTGVADKDRIRAVSPSGKVPALIDGDIAVWDSLAIIEYCAERYPSAKIWPADRAARAHARSVSAEMHSGFQALRTECGMNIHRPKKAKVLSDAARADIARIDDIWCDCRQRYGGGKPFLFGDISAADAMFAPVVARFVTYSVDLSPSAEAYRRAIEEHDAYQEWRKAALAETLVIAKFEDG